MRLYHYSDIIMTTMASQITSPTIVYSTIYSGADQSSASLAFVRGNSPVTGEFPTQRASDAENASIWWRHHADQGNPSYQPSNCVQLQYLYRCVWGMVARS